MNFTSVIFNHHSLPFSEECRFIDEAMVMFCTTYYRLRRSGVQTLLMDKDLEIWSQLRVNEKTSFGMWLTEQGNKYRRAGNSAMSELISRTKKMVLDRIDLQDAEYKEWACMSACFCEEDAEKCEDSPVLMAAEKRSMSMLSVRSRSVWEKVELQAVYTWIVESQLVTQKKRVYNFNDINSIQTIKKAVIEQTPDIQTILQSWGFFFPKIEKGKDVDEQLKWLSTRPQCRRVLSDLFVISSQLEEGKDPRSLNCEMMKDLGVEASDESDTVKNRLKDSRCFPFKDHTSRICFKHLKYSDGVRLHYQMDEKGMHVGYIGTHLPI